VGLAPRVADVHLLNQAWIARYDLVEEGVDTFNGAVAAVEREGVLERGVVSGEC
jgi:hypothetical protein